MSAVVAVIIVLSDRAIVAVSALALVMTPVAVNRAALVSGTVVVMGLVVGVT